MLVHCFQPSVYSLLPSLPAELAPSGSVSRLRCRGSVELSIQWRQGNITRAEIIFGSRHPWLYGFTEDNVKPGHFKANYRYDGDSLTFPSSKSVSTFSDDIAIKIKSPNPLKLVGSRVVGRPLEKASARAEGALNVCASTIKQFGADGSRTIKIKLLSFPCAVVFES